MDGLTRTQMRIAETAAEILLARGFRRTSMAEIATAAQVSRQGLYNCFPSKDAVFTAVVRLLNDRLLREIAAETVRLKSARARVRHACDRWSVAIFTLQRNFPDARDMDDLSFAVVREVYGDFVQLVASFLTGVEDPEDCARMLVFAIRGLAGQARNEADLQSLADRLIGLAVPA